MQAVIMAGGKGTRLSSITKDVIPKPMVPFCGKPLIERSIELLVNNGIKDIIICVGYLSEKIVEYLGDGSRYGAHIHFIQENEPLGTAGALYYVKEYIWEDFILVYADLLFDINVERMYQFHKKNQAAATLFVHPNSHPFDSDLIVSDSYGKVERIDFKGNVRDYDYDNCVNAGITIFSKEIFKYVEQPEKLSLEKDVVQRMIEAGEQVLAYYSPEYVKDVGTPERIAVAEAEYLSGKIERLNLKFKQKAVFLDRDGTLNLFKGLITNPNQIELVPDIKGALRKINESEFMALVVTNQPVIARGDCTEEEVANINRRLVTLLGQEGVYVDDLAYCPHHPDKGYEGERPELKIQCNCRKPNTGMIDAFVEKYNIDLEQSWMIGDTYRDIQTGKNAGMKTVLVKSDANQERERFDALEDYYVTSLLDAVNVVMAGNR